MRRSGSFVRARRVPPSALVRPAGRRVRSSPTSLPPHEVRDGYTNADRAARSLSDSRSGLVSCRVRRGRFCWFLHWRARFPVSVQPAALRNAQVALSVLAMVAVLAMRGRVAHADGLERNNGLIQLWVIGEAPALFGGVLFLLTNESQWYGLGLLVMLATFVLTPISRSS